MEDSRTNPDQVAPDGDDGGAEFGSARPGLAQRMRERGGTPWTIGHAPAGPAGDDPSGRGVLVGEPLHRAEAYRDQHLPKVEDAPIDLSAYLLDPPPSAAELARDERRRLLVRRSSIACVAVLAVVLLAPLPGRPGVLGSSGDPGSLVGAEAGGVAGDVAIATEPPDVPARRVDVPASRAQARTASRDAAARRARAAAAARAAARRRAAARAASGRAPAEHRVAPGGDRGGGPRRAGAAPGSSTPAAASGGPSAAPAPARVPEPASAPAPAPAPAPTSAPAGTSTANPGSAGPSGGGSGSGSGSGARPIASAPGGGALTPVV